MGCFAVEEIHASQLRRAKDLLLETDFPLAQVADLVGFRYPEYLVRFFRHITIRSVASYKLRIETAREI